MGTKPGTDAEQHLQNAAGFDPEPQKQRTDDCSEKEGLTMDQELFDKLIDLIIQTKHECTMEGEDKNPLIYGSNEGVEMMSRMLQRNLWRLASELSLGVKS